MYAVLQRKKKQFYKRNKTVYFLNYSEFQNNNVSLLLRCMTVDINAMFCKTNYKK